MTPFLPLGWLWAWLTELAGDPVVGVLLLVLVLWTPLRILGWPLVRTLQSVKHETELAGRPLKFQGLDQFSQDLESPNPPQTVRALQAGLAMMAVAGALLAIQAAFVAVTWWPKGSLPAGALWDAACAATPCALEWNGFDLLAPPRSTSPAALIGLVPLWLGRAALSARSGKWARVALIVLLQLLVVPVAAILFIEVGHLYGSLLHRLGEAVMGRPDE